MTVQQRYVLLSCLFFLLFGVSSRADDFPTHSPNGGLKKPRPTRLFRPKGSLEVSPKTPIKKASRFFQGKRIALLVGVSKYNTSAWTHLRYPISDVAKMKSLLRNIGGFDTIMTMSSPKHTTRRSFLSFLGWLKQKVRSPHDTVFIYFSGHGTIAPTEPRKPPERYLVFSDSNKKITQTGYPISKLKQFLETLPAKQKALMLATCYVGSQSMKLSNHRAKSMASGTKGTYSLGSRSKTTLILSAAGFMQSAYEVKELKGDVYTHFFAQCAKQKKNARISAIHYCSSQRTHRYVKEHLAREQTPLLESKVQGQNTFLLRPTHTTNKYRNPAKAHRKFGWLHVVRRKIASLIIREKGTKGNSKKVHLPRQIQGSVELRLQQGNYVIFGTTNDGQSFRASMHIDGGESRTLDWQSGKVMIGNDEDGPLGGKHFGKQSRLPPHPLPDIRGGGYVQAEGGMFDGDGYFGAGVGFWTMPATFGVNFSIANFEDKQSQATSGILVQFGFPAQFGYTISNKSMDFFPFLHLELGGKAIKNKERDIAFYFCYGLGLRARYFFTTRTAVHLEARLQFLTSPDIQLAETNLFGEFEYGWSHKFQFRISVGFDFEWPSQVRN